MQKHYKKLESLRKVLNGIGQRIDRIFSQEYISPEQLSTLELLRKRYRQVWAELENLGYWG